MENPEIRGVNQGEIHKGILRVSGESGITNWQTQIVRIQIFQQILLK